MKSLTHVFLSVVLFNASANAAINTFDVSLSESAGSTHNPIVFGTITLDPDTDIIFGSELFFLHRIIGIPTGPSVALPSLPVQTGTPGMNLDWVLDGDDLYITRLTTTSDSIKWTTLTPDEHTLAFRSGDSFPLAIFGTDHTVFNRDSDHFDRAILKPESGPDGPLGFFVGTLSDDVDTTAAIPEPTSVVV